MKGTTTSAVSSYPAPQQKVHRHQPQLTSQHNQQTSTTNEPHTASLRAHTTAAAAAAAAATTTPPLPEAGPQARSEWACSRDAQQWQTQHCTAAHGHAASGSIGSGTPPHDRSTYIFVCRGSHVQDLKFRAPICDESFAGIEASRETVFCSWH